MRTVHGGIHSKARLYALALLSLAACSKPGAMDAAAVTAAHPAARAPANAEEPSDPMDLAISDRVRLALQRDRTTGPDAKSVSVPTAENVVTLIGTVSSEAVKARFSAVAKAVGSVKGVENRLQVRKP